MPFTLNETPSNPIQICMLAQVHQIASNHIINSLSRYDSASSYSRKDQVAFENCNLLTISHIGHSLISKNLTLLDVLVVPYLTKSLLSISKLTHDSPVDVLLYANFFAI